LFDQSEKLRRIEESKLSRKKEFKVERIGLLPRSEVTGEEHPLSFGRSSLWNQYFQVLFHSSTKVLCKSYVSNKSYVCFAKTSDDRLVYIYYLLIVFCAWIAWNQSICIQFVVPRLTGFAPLTIPICAAIPFSPSCLVHCQSKPYY
jgi:hypothetical protein